MKTATNTLNPSTAQNISLIARRGTVSILIISVVLSLANFVFFIQNPGWFEGGSALLWLTMLTAGFLSFVFYRTKRSKAAIWLLVGSLIFLTLIYPFLLRGSSLPISLVCVISVIVFGGRSLNPKNLGVILAAGSVLVVISYLLDTFGLRGRPAITDSLSAIFSVLVISSVFIDLRATFSIYSLRTKVLLSFLILSLIILTVIAGLSISS
jgi:hypothetical protein